MNEANSVESGSAYYQVYRPTKPLLLTYAEPLLEIDIVYET